MPPQLLPCQYCDRLYSQFSIGLHEPQCLSNPNRHVKLPTKRGTHSSIGGNGTANKPLPALERRSRSVSSSLNSSNSSVSTPTAQEDRPPTRTIGEDSELKRKTKSRNMKRRPKTPPTQSLDLLQQSTEDTKRVCFVCGSQISTIDLMIHEIECEAEWRTARREFPPNIKAISPRPMRIPSVDGTVDPRRLDFFAEESARKAQRARCLRCCRHVSFGDVQLHQCTRFEPTVQFFF
ncbi:hypothetical protein M3Y95_00388800 [Aphelenchoides besseyi]|nr:hypothetical protein M3Y95_00388800 [Aphelenchoides besseyi]